MISSQREDTQTQSVMFGVIGEIEIYFFLINPFSLFYRKNMPDLLYSIYSLGHLPHVPQKPASLNHNPIDDRGRNH